MTHVDGALLTVVHGHSARVFSPVASPSLGAPAARARFPGQQSVSSVLPPSSAHEAGGAKADATLVPQVASGPRRLPGAGASSGGLCRRRHGACSVVEGRTLVSAQRGGGEAVSAEEAAQPWGHRCQVSSFS